MTYIFTIPMWLALLVLITQAILILLKITGVIGWAWLLVLTPFGMIAALWALLCIVVLLKAATN